MRFDEAIQELPEAVTRQLGFKERVDQVKDSLIGMLHEGEHQVANFEARQAILQASSFSLMNSALLQKVEEGKEKKARPNRGEVQRHRTKILQGITPLRMNCENLFAVLYRFGITNRIVAERAHRYLKSTDDGIPFDVFYRLMRALQQPRHRTGQSKAQLDDATVAKWFDSDMLCNLLFVAITNAPFAGVPLGQQKGFDLSVADVLASLRLLVCHALILDVEQHSRKRADRAPGSDSNPNLGLEGHTDNEQGGLSAHGLHMLADCLHQMLTRQGAASTPHKVATVDESAFHRFLGEVPTVFGCLLRLLLPLVLQGRSFLNEDIELTRKRQDHRTGELQARMNRRIYREQTMLLERLWKEFTQPVLEKRHQLALKLKGSPGNRLRRQVTTLRQLGRMLGKPK